MDLFEVDGRQDMKLRIGESPFQGEFRHRDCGESVGKSGVHCLSHRTSDYPERPKALHKNTLRISISDDSPGIGRPVHSLPIQGALNAASSSVQHVRANHRRAHIFATKQGPAWFHKTARRRLLTDLIRGSNRVPFDFGTERVSDSASSILTTAYDLRKREYCNEEVCFRGGRLPLPTGRR
jgi:hypothetical protein